jgi:hypothetical protein
MEAWARFSTENNRDINRRNSKSVMRSSVGGPIITLGTDPLDRQMDRGPFDYLSRWSISQAVKFRRATLRRQRQMQHAKPRSFSFNQTRPPTWYFCGTYFLYYSNINPLSPPPPAVFLQNSRNQDILLRREKYWTYLCYRYEMLARYRENETSTMAG